MDAEPPITHLLYLHGFRSSPASAKAQQTLAWIRENAPSVHCWCPQLPPSPKKAMAWVDAVVATWPIDHRTELGVIGSSLGGFYATRITQHTGCRAVLINTAVAPAGLLAAHIGEQSSLHGDEVFFFRAEFIDELRALEVGDLREPVRLMAWVAQGDEVLDWRVLAARYAATHLRLLDGDCHALSSYPDHLAELMAFLGLPATSS